MARPMVMKLGGKTIAPASKTWVKKTDLQEVTVTETYGAFEDRF